MPNLNAAEIGQVHQLLGSYRHALDSVTDRAKALEAAVQEARGVAARLAPYAGKQVPDLTWNAPDAAGWRRHADATLVPAVKAALKGN